MLRSDNFFKLFKNNDFLEIIKLVFPQLKNIHQFSKLNEFAKKNFNKMNFIFLLSLMAIDGSDNVDYFIYKFNISKKDKKRILFLNDFYSKKITIKTFSEKNLNKIFYFHGNQTLKDVILFKIFKSSKVDYKLLKLVRSFENKVPPILPLRAITLMTKYNIPEGKKLGVKLKMIEELWVDNNFKISENEVQEIVNG